MESISVSCGHCDLLFPSKTQLFKHLVVHGYVGNSVKPSKVVLLVGWLSSYNTDEDVWISEQTVLTEALDETTQNVEKEIFKAWTYLESNGEHTSSERPKGYSRGSSCQQRSSILFGSERTCNALCETFCFQARPLGSPELCAQRVDEMNKILSGNIRVLECYELPSEAGKNFHAEIECSQRRYEYMMPLNVIMPPDIIQKPTEKIVRKSNFRNNTAQSMDHMFPIDNEEGQMRINYFRSLKRIFKALSGKHNYHNYVTAGAVANDSSVQRRVDRIFHKELIRLDDEESTDGEPWVVFSVSGDTLLRGQVRKLLGITVAVACNFLPFEYLEHSLNVRSGTDSVFEDHDILEIPSLPGCALYLAECRYANWEAKYGVRVDPRRVASSSTNDVAEEDEQMFAAKKEELHWPALSNWRQILQQHIVKQSKNIFHENFVNEFKNKCQDIYCKYNALKSIKLERLSMNLMRDLFVSKFGSIQYTNASNVLLTDEEVKEIENSVKVNVSESVDEKKSIEEEVQTGEEVQQKNNKKRNKQPNQSNKREKRGKKENAEDEVTNSSNNNSNNSNNNSSNNARCDLNNYNEKAAKLLYFYIPQDRDDCPAIYREALHYLRLADRSGAWPASSTGRQSVIENKTLLEFGGRGGSLSVGALPKHLAQPKCNELFPDLMRACFLLEKALLPNRPPSATIAINRHAQFLPHRDTGAGAGQTVSLIVSLGAFVGGEIVIDNVVHDIRYKPIEFDGWQQIHQTLPFVGERYSLVWFTPLGLTQDDLWWWKVYN